MEVMQGESLNPTLQEDDLLCVPPVQEHLLRSEEIRQTFRIQVMLPARRRSEIRRYPVVYITDGNWVFDMCKSISHLLQMSVKDAPPFILVGIGYPGDSPFAGAMLRVREFTAAPYPMIEPDLDAYRDYVARRNIDHGLHEGMLMPEPGAKRLYGAEEFRRFIAEQLIPFIDGSYPTDPGHRTYFGHSGGGYFGFFTLLTQPELFNNYIVSSPGLRMHGEVPGGKRFDNYDFGVQMLRDFLASGRTLSGRRLYISAGSEEEFEAALGSWQLLSGFYQVVRFLRGSPIPGLEFMSEVFPGESHNTAWPIAFIHGVQAMLGTRRVTPSIYF